MRLTMKGRRGILLKMIAHAGAIDYQRSAFIIRDILNRVKIGIYLS